MTTKAVREESSCPWREHEVAFVTAIDYSLVRDAKMHGVGPDELLARLIQPLRGVFSAHLGRHPYKCQGEMVGRLTLRMIRISCLTWKALFEMAVESRRVDQHIHVARCPFCKRDVRQLGGKLPFYTEFSLDKPPEP